MAIALTDSDSLGFGVTSAGVVYNFPTGAPSVTDLDILCVNSDATINTPSGWTLGKSQVGNQGSYIFYRKGGAGSSVTVSSVQSPGPFNATLIWSRWTGTNAIDIAVSVAASGSANVTPTLSTGALAQTGELVFMFGALHSTGTGNQTTPVWSSGFTGAEFVKQGSSSSGCIAAGGYKLNAGTAAESPTVSWSGAGVLDRFTLIVSFTATVATNVSPDSITDAISLGAPALGGLSVAPDSVTDPIVLGSPTLTSPPQPLILDPVVEIFTQALSCLCTAVNSAPNPPAHCAPRVGLEVAYDLGQYTDYCCEGLAYVSLGDSWLSQDSFPDQDIVRQVQGSCVPGTWAQDFKLGIVRCSPVGQPDGEPPTDDDWTTASIQNLYDAQSLRRAVCCVRNWVLNNVGIYLGMSVVINRQTQGTPNGGCVERSAMITVQFPNLDCLC